MTVNKINNEQSTKYIAPLLLVSLMLACFSNKAQAAPSVSRLTPPSELFTSGRSNPLIARFLPDQRFDLQATIKPEDETRSIASARFLVDGAVIGQEVAIKNCSTGCLPGVTKNSVIATVRAV